MPGWVIPAMFAFVVVDAIVVMAVMSRVVSGRGPIATLAQHRDELVSATAEVLAGLVGPDAEPDLARTAVSGARGQIEELLKARGIEPTVPIVRLLVKDALQQLGAGPRQLQAALAGIAA
ncbi:MAG TPA: hypothetical protein VFK69_02935 [Candidatus Eisenbacteria bacterium]|nr:hypothetical protein [Candidatus Eisenbacteria bacterium]